MIIENLTKRYGNKTLFDGFSYAFPERGVYIIEGDSGIGKTTLLRMIAGLDTFYEGSINGGGIGNVSFVFQEYRLFSHLSALENVTLVSGDGEDAVQRATDILASLKLYDEDIHLTPDKLSGGMKQRVALARAIMYDKPILLLDEPTKELDPVLSDHVLSVIKKEGERRLVIMVSHSQTAHIINDATYIRIARE